MNNKTITRAVSNTSLMLKSPQKNLQCLIKHYDLKDVANYFFTSDVEYYMNAKDILWVIWRHCKSTYGKRLPKELETLIKDLNRFIAIYENSKEKWTDNNDLISRFERYCNLK